MTYYKRQKGEVAQKYRVVSGKHSRKLPDEERPDGERRLRLVSGDEFHPTPDELEKFSDKFEPVMVPEKVPEEEALEDEGDEDEGDEDLTKDDFSSPQAFDLWNESKRPDLSGVPRTGHGGDTYSKSDVEGALG